MTDEGKDKFTRLMEEAIKGVVLQAFTQEELDLFHVKRMTTSTSVQ